jgi:hypothetical protein
MYIIEINTTAYKEENFYALTNIPSEDLESCISDFLTEERTKEIEDYMNEEIERYVNNHFSLCKLNYFEIKDIKYLSI